MPQIPFSLSPGKAAGSSFAPEEFNQIVSTLTSLIATYPMANIPTPASLGLFANKSAGVKMFSNEYNSIVTLLNIVILKTREG